MKGTVSLISFLLIFSFLKTYQTEPIEFSLHSILAKLIKGTLTFDSNLWGSLNDKNSLTDIKDYDILKPLLALYNTRNLVGDKKYGKEIEEFFIKIKNNFNNIEIYYKKMLNNYLDHSSLNSEQSNKRREKFYLFSEKMIQSENPESPTTIINETAKLFSEDLTNLKIIKLKPKEYSRTCSDFNNRISLQSFLYDVLTAFVVAEIQVYSTVTMALKNLNHVIPKDTIHYDAIKACHVTTVRAVKNYMTELSRDVWRCQPDSLEDDTHVKLNHVFQEHLLSTKDHPTYKNNNKCAGFDCMKDVEKSLRKCPKPFDPKSCRQITKTMKTAKICLSNANTGRRYEFIDVTYLKNAKNLTLLPDIMDYSKNIIRILDASKQHRDPFQSKIEVFERIGKVRPICENPLVNVYGSLECCQIFSCTCDDDVDFKDTKILSERWFYGGLVQADDSNDYVITGMRFRKTKTGVVHIQIQQGKLIEGGNINASTLHWKVTPDDVLNSRNDHFKLTLEEKYIELMDIDLTNNEILVGIGIKKENDEKKPLRLIAVSKKFDFLSGKLTGRLELKQSEKPSGNIVSNLVPYAVPVTNAYLSFGTSNLKLDLGQTTVPFIDIQEVTTTRPYPMAGVGLYYRYSSEHELAGFLAIKLKTYDFSQELSA